MINVGICKYCGSEVEKKKMGAHAIRCPSNPKYQEYLEINRLAVKRKSELRASLNPKIEHIAECSVCKTTFTQQVTQRSLNQDKQKKTCSRKCASSISGKGKLGVKQKSTNQLPPARQEFQCVCGNLYIAKGTFPRKYCSKQCDEYRKMQSNAVKGKCGGWRNFGGSGKKGKYKGILFQSSWELAWMVYMDDHKLPYIRNEDWFPYEHDGKSRKYYPDYVLSDGTYVEIKGFVKNNKAHESKISHFPHKLIVLNKDEIEPILSYVREKYGNDFVAVLKD